MFKTFSKLIIKQAKFINVCYLQGAQKEKNSICVLLGVPVCSCALLLTRSVFCYFEQVLGHRITFRFLTIEYTISASNNSIGNFQWCKNKKRQH